MEDVMAVSKERELVKKELLEKLKYFEENDWQILRWQHMNMDKERWVKKPEKLRDCEYYKIIKSWLENGVKVPKKSKQEGLVKYVNSEEVQELKVESVWFTLLIFKGEMGCAISYGEHNFNIAVYEQAFGRASYSLVFKNIVEFFLAFVQKYTN